MIKYYTKLVRDNIIDIIYFYLELVEEGENK